jgi:hypothetical protein
MPGLHHGAYSEEWGIGTTTASLKDFNRSMLGSGTDSQDHVLVTIKFDDDSSRQVRVYIDRFLH